MACVSSSHVLDRDSLPGPSRRKEKPDGAGRGHLASVARSVLYLQLSGAQPVPSSIHHPGVGGKEAHLPIEAVPTILHRAGGEALLLRNVNNIDSTEGEEDVMAFARTTFSATLEEESGLGADQASSSPETAALFSTVGARSYFPPLPLRRRVEAMDVHSTNEVQHSGSVNATPTVGGELQVGFKIGSMQYFLVDKRTLKQYEASAFVAPATGKQDEKGSSDSTTPISNSFKCPKGHALQIYSSRTWRCDKCGHRSTGMLDTSFACRACDFDLCRNCLHQ
jgi:hypothetical protein